MQYLGTIFTTTGKKKQLLRQIKKMTTYLWGKKSELKSLDERDVLLAKVVIEIHQEKSHSEFVFVPLFALHQIHPINRDNASRKTQDRINMLQTKKAALLKNKNLSKDELSRCLPQSYSC